MIKHLLASLIVIGALLSTPAGAAGCLANTIEEIEAFERNDGSDILYSFKDNELDAFNAVEPVSDYIRLLIIRNKTLPAGLFIVVRESKSGCVDGGILPKASVEELLTIIRGRAS